MGTKRAFRSSIGLTVHDVPSTTGDRSAAAAGTPGAPVCRYPASSDSDPGRRIGSRLCVSDCHWSRFDSSAVGGNVGGVLPRVAYSAGCLHFRRARQLGCRGITVRWSSGVSSSHGITSTRGPSGLLSCSLSRVRSELASDSAREQREGGDTFEQLDGVSRARAPER